MHDFRHTFAACSPKALIGKGMDIYAAWKGYFSQWIFYS
jgi:hypothetical protein